MEYNKEIGRWIYEERQKGRTFQSIADELGTSVSTPYKWVNKYIGTLEQECSCTKSDNDYDLLSGEELHIYTATDWHLGNPQCNYELIEHWCDTFKEDNNEKIIIGLGDALDIGSKSIGNSAFKQELNVNEQMNKFVSYLKPFKKYIVGMVNGNHSNNRLSKDYDFDIDMEIAEKLGTKCYNRKTNIFNINNLDYSIYYRHGSGSASKDHLAYGKIVRDNINVHSDLVLQGHLHKLIYTNRVIDYGEYNYKRQHFCYCGSMLNFAGSYGDVNGMSPLLPGYLVVGVSYNDCNNKLVTGVKMYNSDEIL